MRTVAYFWRKLISAGPIKQGLLIFAVSFLVRVAFIYHFHTFADLSRTELERTAISLASTGVYGNPYALPTGPTGHVAPGYTLILATVFRLFGTGVKAEIIKQLFASIIPSLLYALLPLTAQIAIDKTPPGLIAGLISALYPARPLVETRGDWETPYTGLILATLFILTVRLWTEQRWPLKRALKQGFVWGVALLFVPALLVMFFVFIAGNFFFRDESTPQRLLMFSFVQIAVVALCLSPWIARNEKSLGYPVVTRTNFGIELHISNNDDATPDQRVNYLSGVFSKYHPLLSKSEALKVRQEGEIAYNKRLENIAKHWIQTHPRRFLELTLGRMRCYWLYYDPTSLIKTVFLAATVLLGFGGLWVLLNENRVAGTVAALILLIYPLPNYLVHVGLRQEYPIHWLMTLLAVLFTLHCLEPRAASHTASARF